jgi:hypothetical protein
MKRNYKRNRKKRKKKGSGNEKKDNEEKLKTRITKTTKTRGNISLLLTRPTHQNRMRGKVDRKRKPKLKS